MASVEEWRPQWLSAIRLPPDLILHVHGCTFRLHKFPMVSRSGKLAELLSETPHGEPLRLSLTGIPADAPTFETVAKFCYGHDVLITPANFLSLYTVASYLQMTDSFCHDNLQNKTIAFFHNRVIHDWNSCIAVLKSCQKKQKLSYVQKPLLIPIIRECLSSIAEMASHDPSLLGPPLENPALSQQAQRITAGRRRRLFDSDRQDLITLDIGYYELAMISIKEHSVPAEYISGSLLRYVRERLRVNEEDFMPEILETIESIMPIQTGIIPCKYLIEMLRWAITFQASEKCQESLQQRIGKQLDEVDLQDLLIPSSAYSQQTKYDIECVSRIFKSYSESCHDVDIETLSRAYALVDNFLLEAAKDENLNVKEFVKLIECCPNDPRRCSDGLYRAIEIFVDVHGYLTESEKERVCQMLDCQNLTWEACAHAMMNQRMPVRVLANIVFMGQLHLRNTIVNSDVGDDKAQECGGSGSGSGSGGSGGVGGISTGNSGSDHHNYDVRALRAEMERMDMKVMELVRVGRSEKRSFWRELKAILGCGRSLRVHDSYKDKDHPN
ncbi:BTB/POZ domain-containing protein At1g30440-like [Nymphaea colorata]|nr:BTB/POZ domain-containing protein At1g30440-like [Nymphaea colorata]